MLTIGEAKTKTITNIHDDWDSNPVQLDREAASIVILVDAKRTQICTELRSTAIEL